MSRTPSYSSWIAMIHRCLNPKRKQYSDYGGRGIVPCKFIEASIVNLVSVIGEKPEPMMTIERINNATGYTCGSCPQCKENKWVLNVRWATRPEQSRNKRNNFWILHNGVKKLRGELAKELGVSVGFIRVHYG